MFSCPHNPDLNFIYYGHPQRTQTLTFNSNHNFLFLVAGDNLPKEAIFPLLGGPVLIYLSERTDAKGA